MGYLADEFGLYLGRLQYIYCNNDAQDLAVETQALVTQIHVPEQRHLPTEMGYLTGLLGGYVAAVGVQDYQGVKSMIVMQRGPRTLQLMTLLARARQLAGRQPIVRQFELDHDEVTSHYASRCEESDLADVELLGITAGLKGFAAELCGYPTLEMINLAATDCAFPTTDHSCQGEFFNDVFQAWIDGHMRVPEPGA